MKLITVLSVFWQDGARSLSSALGKDTVDSTKMTFGFFEDYFATDTAATISPPAPVTVLPITNSPHTSKSENSQKVESPQTINVTEESEKKKTAKKASVKISDLDSKNIPSRSESECVAMEIDEEVVVEEKGKLLLALLLFDWIVIS